MEYGVIVVGYDVQDFQPKQWRDNPKTARFELDITDMVDQKFGYTYENCLELAKGFNLAEIACGAGLWALIIDAKMIPLLNENNIINISGVAELN